MSAAVLFIVLVNGRLGVRRAVALRPAGERAISPDIRLPDLNGNLWRMSDKKGQVVLVNFWATWCPPCRAEIPDLVRIAREFRSSDFELVGIAMDEDGPKVVRDFLARSTVDYTVLLPSIREIAAFGVETLPSTYLVDKRGKVAKSFVGAVDRREIEQDVRQLLGEE